MSGSSSDEWTTPHRHARDLRAPPPRLPAPWHPADDSDTAGARIARSSLPVTRPKTGVDGDVTALFEGSSGAGALACRRQTPRRLGRRDGTGAEPTAPMGSLRVTSAWVVPAAAQTRNHASPVGHVVSLRLAAAGRDVPVRITGSRSDRWRRADPGRRCGQISSERRGGLMARSSASDKRDKKE